MQILAHSRLSANASDPDVIDAVRNILMDHKHHDGGYGSEEACLLVERYSGVTRRAVAKVCQLAILGLAVVHLLKELLQFTRARLAYFSFANFIEWVCYVTAIVFVVDLTGCHGRTGLRYSWQWQVGTICVTMTWLNLLANIRKFPFLGIYVLMFADVLATFLKLSIIIVLFVVAFSLGFYCLLAEQDIFSDPVFSSLKTAVMMVGELEFASIFLDASADADANVDVLPYAPFTLAFFIAFMVVMAIIVMNLLVGLAVDDIKGVQDSAILKRLAMQVTLSLDVEMLLLEFMRRKMIIRKQTLFPNARRNLLSQVYHDGYTLHAIKEAVVSKKNETELGVMASRQCNILSKVECLPSMLRQMKQLADEVGARRNGSRRRSRRSSYASRRTSRLDHSTSTASVRDRDKSGSASESRRGEQ